MIKYRVLVINQLSKADRDYVIQTLSTVNSGHEAAQLARHGRWTYELLDTRGRCGLLRYRGTEVAIFFQRPVNEIDPLPTDPAPESKLTDPIDAWVRFDLFGLSARQSRRITHEKTKTLEELLALKIKGLESAEAQIARQEDDIARLTKERNAYKEQAAKAAKVPARERGLGQRDVLVEALPVAAALQQACTTPLIDVRERKLFQMLFSMAEKLYANFGAAFIQPPVGQSFDPAVHEAVAVDEKVVHGVIAAVSQTGLMVHGELAVAAKVSVGGKE